MAAVGDPDALLPMHLPTEPAEPTVTADVIQPARRRRILVVDDSEDMRDLLREVLERRGHEVETAGSSGRALGIMRDRVPDLVITDLMMPGMSGFALRSLMLRHPDLVGVPVIVLSAYWRRPSETLDAVAVLTKPINLDRLLETVEAAFVEAPRI